MGGADGHVEAGKRGLQAGQAGVFERAIQFVEVEETEACACAKIPIAVEFEQFANRIERILLGMQQRRKQNEEAKSVNGFGQHYSPNFNAAIIDERK